MKNLFNTLFLMLFLSQFVSAQITLTSANAPTARMAHKSREVDSLTAARLNLGTAAANQTWNFSNLQLNASIPVSLVTYAATTGAPKANLFPTATLISREGLDNSKGITYHRINATEWVTLGDVDSAGQATVSAEPQINFKYPFTYNSSFNDTATIEDPDLGTITVIGNIKGDAWGNVQTTLGTFNALRVKRVYRASISFQGLPIDLIVTNHEWWATQAAPLISHNQIIVDFSAFGIVDTIYSASVITSQTVSTQELAENYITKAYPSPASEFISLDIDIPTATNVSAIIVGMNGQSLSTHTFGELNAGKQTQNLNVSKLNSGIYHVILMSEKGKIGTQKISVTH